MAKVNRPTAKIATAQTVVATTTAPAKKAKREKLPLNQRAQNAVAKRANRFTKALGSVVRFLGRLKSESAPEALETARTAVQDAIADLKPLCTWTAPTDLARAKGARGSAAADPSIGVGSEVEIRSAKSRFAICFEGLQSPVVVVRVRGALALLSDADDNPASVPLAELRAAGYGAARAEAKIARAARKAAKSNL